MGVLVDQQFSIRHEIFFYVFDDVWNFCFDVFDGVVEAFDDVPLFVLVFFAVQTVYAENQRLVVHSVGVTTYADQAINLVVLFTDLFVFY